MGDNGQIFNNPIFDEKPIINNDKHDLIVKSTFNPHTEEEITLNMSEGFLNSFHRPLQSLTSKQEELRNNQQILLEKIKI